MARSHKELTLELRGTWQRHPTPCYIAEDGLLETFPTFYLLLSAPRIVRLMSSGLLILSPLHIRCEERGFILCSNFQHIHLLFASGIQNYLALKGQRTAL